MISDIIIPPGFQAQAWNITPPLSAQGISGTAYGTLSNSAKTIIAYAGPGYASINWGQGLAPAGITRLPLQPGAFVPAARKMANCRLQIPFNLYANTQNTTGFTQLAPVESVDMQFRVYKGSELVSNASVGPTLVTPLNITLVSGLYVSGMYANGRLDFEGFEMLGHDQLGLECDIDVETTQSGLNLFLALGARFPMINAAGSGGAGATYSVTAPSPITQAMTLQYDNARS